VGETSVSGRPIPDHRLGPTMAALFFSRVGLILMRDRRCIAIVEHVVGAMVTSMLPRKILATLTCQVLAPTPTAAPSTLTRLS
jgi:hypothetical protein